MTHTSRRDFLAYLAGSPLLAAAGMDAHRFSHLLNTGVHTKALALAQQALITSASQALDVFDFEPVAKKNIPPAHWGYLMTGVDDDATIRANREGYARWDLRPRRLVDISRIDSSVTLLGAAYDSPVVLCPLGSQRAFHPDGEIASARAAKSRRNLQVLSTVATSSIEDVIAARGAPVWFQLYHRSDWNQTKQMIKRAERAGSPALVFTVDLIGGSNRETMLRAQALDSRQCEDCHLGGKPRPGIAGGAAPGEDARRKPMIADLMAGVSAPEIGSPTWDYVKRLQDATTMRVFIKGIVTHEDAELAMQHGVAGLFVSNHGGRADETTRATITSLPEVVAAVQGRGVVIVDGGVRRGTDVFKALALGANAVGIGRPYIWGLGAFGQEGVQTVLDLLRRELQMTMRQCGTTSIKAITRAYVAPHQV